MIKVDVNASCELIKKRCEDAGLTAKQLQEYLGVTVTAPYMWLYGRGLPKLNTMLNLCELLHCTIMDLLVIQNDDSNQQAEEVSVLHQHYYNKSNRRECWDEMKDISLAGTIYFDLWNAYKYLYRVGDKADNPKSQELQKVQNYVDHAQKLMSEYRDTYGNDENMATFENMLDVINHIQNESED